MIKIIDNYFSNIVFFIGISVSSYFYYVSKIVPYGTILNYLDSIVNRKNIVIILNLISIFIFYYYFGASNKFFYFSVLSLILIILSFIDIDYLIIPDELIIIGSVFSLFINFTENNLINSILGGLICGGITFLFSYIGEKIVKQEVLGGGDIKLFFMIGLFLGVSNGLYVILLSMYLMSFYGMFMIFCAKLKDKKYNSYVAYGPFISIASFIIIFFTY